MNGRIDKVSPCPCGSDEKDEKDSTRDAHKEDLGQDFTAKFRFEPGSYWIRGDFVPSISCVKQISSDECRYHFVMIKHREGYLDEDEANAVAEADLNEAVIQKGKMDSDYGFAIHLKSLGYAKINDFKILKDRCH